MMNSKKILSLTIAALSLISGVAMLYPNQVYSQAGNGDPSYPDVCIASPPPDLNCADVGDKGFTVLSPDPHGFDRDGDGVGCE